MATVLATLVGDVSSDPGAARLLTDKIKLGVEATWGLIVHAYEHGAHRTLGYRDWDDYCAQEFGGARLRLPREERQDVVASLRDSGLSIRAIAAATGSSDQTVQRDLRQVSQITTPEPTDDPDDEWESSARQPPTVTGIDGKSYPAKPPRSEPVTIDIEIEPDAIRRIHNVEERHRWSKSMLSLTKVTLDFEPDEARDWLDESDLISMRLSLRALNSWAKQIEQARTGLRLVEGRP